MTWFSARNISVSIVPVPPDEIWPLVTDPGTLAALTPLVRSIEAVGSDWLWKLNGIEGLGLKVEAAFTERMEFIDQRQIVFSHQPPAGARERAAVEGVYNLTPMRSDATESDATALDATELKVDLTLSVDLPLPRLSRMAVEGIMNASMRVTGQRFASNLYELLGLDPNDVTIKEIA